LPRDSKGLKANECPAATEKCVVTAILNDAEILTSRSERRRDKLIALKFLGHWVGDIHQPLHVSFEDDPGGNNITVSGECSGKMHGAWDSCLLTKAVGDDVSEAAAELAEAITPAMIEQWNASEPFEWATESFAIAEAATTKYCVMHAPSCDPPPSGHVTIDAAYVEQAKPQPVRGSPIYLIGRSATRRFAALHRHVDGTAARACQTRMGAGHHHHKACRRTACMRFR
jgi:hypothetical protein